MRHTCRASVMYLRGGESVQAARLSGVQPAVFTVRQCFDIEGICPAWIIRDSRRGHVYNIRSVVPSDNRLFWEITAERGVAV